MPGLLAEQPFFAGMRPLLLERLSYCARRRSFNANDMVFAEGGEADHWWVLREGRVRLHAHLPEREDAAIETLGPGAVLGWSWMVPPHVWHYSATVVEPGLAIEFDGPSVLQLCGGDTELGYELTKRFMTVVVERLRTSRTRLVNEYRQSTVFPVPPRRP